MVALSVPETRRLVAALAAPDGAREHLLRWSRWRRTHQATARRGHVARRAGGAPPPARWAEPPTVPVPGTPALTDAGWARVAPLLTAKPGRTGRPPRDHRAVVAGILWVLRRGASWRAVLPEHGPWQTLASRYQRWRRDGTWARIMACLSMTEGAMTADRPERGRGLVESGDLTGAYRAATANLARWPHIGAYAWNRGTCLLALGRPEEAPADFRLAARLQPDSDAAPARSGVALWGLGRRAEAAAAWRAATGMAYTDAAGGVEIPALLTFAAVRLGDMALAGAARALLRRHWRPRLARQWPGAIAGLLRGKLDEASFLHGQTFLHPILAARRACRARFWVAVQRERAGDRSGYRHHLRLALEGEEDPARRALLLEHEYWLAKSALAALDAAPDGGDA